jgi:hypothetical protein
MISRFLRICFAERIIRAPEYQACTAPFIQVHVSTAVMTVGLVPDLFSACFRCELPAADEADKSLLAALDLSIFVEGRGIAIGAEQVSLRALW